MTRIAVIADSHFDEASRFDECIRIHHWIAEDMAERDVELVLHAGDVFERRSTPRERVAVADWIRRVTDRAPLVVVRGNHDAPGDLSIFGRLRTRHPVIVEEAAGVHVVGGVAVACVAWPRKAVLLSTLDAGVDQGQAEECAGNALRNLFRGLGDQLEAHEGPRVLLAHAMVRGSRTSTGQPLVGCDMEVGLEDLALARADLVALGHIHMPQEWENDGDQGPTPVIYPGSPRRTAFGEVEEKGYVLVFTGERRCQWLRVSTPATPMFLLEAVWDDDGFAFSQADEGAFAHPNGAEVRFRYTVVADRRDVARTTAEHFAASLRTRGAVHVKVEECVRATSRARVPEIATARTLAEKLHLLWQRDQLSEERQERLERKAVDLEEEHRHAS